MNSDRTNPACGPGITAAQINSSVVLEVPCDLCGRYLSITIPLQVLTLCEVLAFGNECPTHAGNKVCVYYGIFELRKKNIFRKKVLFCKRVVKKLQFFPFFVRVLSSIKSEFHKSRGVLPLL